MSPTHTYYTDADLEASIAIRSAGGRDRSAVLRRIVARYEEMVRHTMPRLTAKEWKSAVVFFSGAEAHDPLVAKWLTRITPVEVIAILDAITRYKAAVARGEKPEMLG